MFLQVDFHKENSERWTVRESKAKWCLQHLSINPGAGIIDLGCGDGLLDICLSRLGINVTAIDHGSPVIENARNEDNTKRVNFIEGKLQEVHFSPKSFEGALLLETAGLMSKEEDLDLLRRIYGWLKNDRKIIVDCPHEPTFENSWSKEFSFGKVFAETSFDKKTRIHQLNFEFHPNEGEPFVLQDPGIRRYIYTQEEMETFLKIAGFRVIQVAHYYGESYWALTGIK